MAKKALKKSIDIDVTAVARNAKMVGSDTAMELDLQEPLVALNVSVPKSYRTRLRMLCAKHGLNMTEICRKAVMDMIDNRDV